MKELSVEEKAKRYDSMFERLKEMYNNKTNVADRLIYERYFPELKESENKRMIQYFKDLAPFDKADELYEKYGFSHKDAIAWLEKQCEHSNFLSKIQVGDKVTRNEDGVLVNLSQLNRVAKKDEKQGEKGINGNEREIPNSSWSGEDEDNMMMIEDRLSDYLDYIREDTSLTKHQKNSMKEEVIGYDNWFKSLRERYIWKPSDEQMYNLSEAAHYNCAFFDMEILKGLYDDLKKLKGE